MYKSIEIERFRSIKHLEISDFKRINLFVGENNCGKTSILEAIFLLSGMANPQLATNVHLFRGLLLDNDEDLSYIFNDFDLSEDVILSGTNSNKSNRSLIISPRYETSPSKKDRIKEESITHFSGSSASSGTSNHLEGIDYKSNYDNIEYKSSFSFTKKQVTTPNNYKEKLKCRFLNQDTIMRGIDERLDKIIEKKRLNEILEVLKTIEPNVADIRLGINGLIRIDVGKDSMFPINIMGDGIRRLLSILSSIIDLKDGVLLVDEIENGLHYSSLSVLWKAVIKACEIHNVQLIATTHSYECVEAMVKECKAADENFDEARLFRLERDEHAHNVIKADIKLLEVSLAKNYEIR